MSDKRREGTDMWGCCPVCWSDDVDGKHVQIEREEAWQDVMCLACEATWTEVYYMSMRSNIEEKK